MPRVPSGVRTAVPLALIPCTLAVAAETQNVQTVLLGAAFVYVGFTAGYLWLSSDANGTPRVIPADFAMRRPGAFALALFTLFIAAMISQRYVLGVASALVVYLGGVLDAATVRLDGDGGGDGAGNA